MCRAWACRLPERQFRGDWIYVQGTGFSISWLQANNLQESVTAAFIGGFPSIFLLPASASANGITGSGTMTPLNGGTTQVTLNLGANAGGSPLFAGHSITSLNPSSTQTGQSPSPHTISGSNFAPGATVNWTFNGNTTQLPNVTVSHANTITAQTPASFPGTPGAAQITGTSGGSVSNSLPFTIITAGSSLNLIDLMVTATAPASTYTVSTAATSFTINQRTIYLSVKPPRLPVTT